MRLPIFIFAAAAAASLIFSDPGSAGQGVAGPRWRAWNPGLSEAAGSGKPVLVDVYTDWCGWCRRMDHDVYGRRDVSEYLDAHFVTVRLNAESPEAASYQGRSFSGTSLAGHFGVSGYPTTIFLRSGGDHLVNVPGYVPADRFLLLLRYIGDGHLDRGESFEVFTRNAAR